MLGHRKVENKKMAKDTYHVNASKRNLVLLTYSHANFIMIKVDSKERYKFTIHKLSLIGHQLYAKHHPKHFTFIVLCNPLSSFVK